MRITSPSLGYPKYSLKANRLLAGKALTHLLETSFQKAGLDLDEIGALFEQNNAEARESRAKLISTSEILDAFLPAVRNSRLLDRLKTLTRLGTPFVVLGTANDIVVDRDGPGEGRPDDFTAVSTHIEPENNWARFKYLEEAGDVTGPFGFGGGVDTRNVAFRFFWLNPSDAVAEIDVAGFIELQGVGDVQSDGGVLPGNRFCQASVEVKLEIRELWNNPPTSPIEQPTQSQTVIDLSFDSSGFVDSPAGKTGIISASLELDHTHLIVPGRRAAIFDISCIFHLFANEGSVNYYFQSSFWPSTSGPVPRCRN